VGIIDMRSYHRHNLVGQKFGRLTVINENGRLNKGVAYDCLCDCGGTKRVRSANLTRGITKSCGCTQYDKSHCRGKDRKKILLTKEYKAMLRRNIDLGFGESDISFNDFRYLASLDCFYCGKEPTNTTRDGYKKYYVTDYVLRWTGPDRINPLLGYSKENCVPCCDPCNKMKSSLSPEEFENFIDRLCAFQK